MAAEIATGLNESLAVEPLSTTGSLAKSTEEIPSRDSSTSHASLTTTMLSSTKSSSTHRTATATTINNATSSTSTTAATTNKKYFARDMAALEFLTGIPLEREIPIVMEGFHHQQQQRRSAPITKGSWWESILRKHTDIVIPNNNIFDDRSVDEDEDDVQELERPSERAIVGRDQARRTTATSKDRASSSYAPGSRRLMGDAAVHVRIPLTQQTRAATTHFTKHKSVARQAALREWELKTAHGLVPAKAVSTSKSNSNNLQQQQPPLLNGRIFFSAAGAYPTEVFSLIRYEPRKEEAALRRQKLEARGGGGSQFEMPIRDWRGISYRALLMTRSIKNQPQLFKNTSSSQAFNRFLQKNDKHGDALSLSSHDTQHSNDVSSDDDDESYYEPGLLDDPDMVLGKHRNVTIGDKVTGPIISSTIQFVKPTVLKAELNKQFRDRFDGWEPPRSARKYIGARVIDGEYRLMDPAIAGDKNMADDEDPQQSQTSIQRPQRNRQGSITSVNTSSTTDGGGKTTAAHEITIRMPPSLTLSKIRSLKHQALQAAVRAKVEIGTVALACVYFERLCLDCRVDKSNRRLTFAVCLLLAAKLNEPNVGLVMKKKNSRDESSSSTPDNNSTGASSGNVAMSRIQAWVRPNKRSQNMFASLLEFFTEEWNLSLKSLFDAEFGVFAALRFELHASPSQVAFHYRRLMKSLEWNSLTYLGDEMYRYWQDALEEEDRRKKEREERKERKLRLKEERLLNLQIEIENEVLRRSEQRSESDLEDDVRTHEAVMVTAQVSDNEMHDDHRLSPSKLSHSTGGGLSLLSRFGRMRRITSQEDLNRVSRHGNFIRRQRRKTAEHMTELAHSPSMPQLLISEALSNRSTQDVSIDRDDIGAQSDDGIVL